MINNSLHLLYLYLRISYNFDFSFISETTQIFIELIISFVNKLVRDQVKKLSLCRKLKFSNPYFSQHSHRLDIFLKEIFFTQGHDRVVTIKSRNFSVAKVWCRMVLYWSTRGCNLAAHTSIHASFILRRGLTRFQLLLRPENNRVQEFFWYTGMRGGCYSDRKHHTHCSQSFVSPDWIPQGIYSWQP